MFPSNTWSAANPLLDPSILSTTNVALYSLKVIVTTTTVRETRARTPHDRLPRPPLTHMFHTYSYLRQFSTFRAIICILLSHFFGFSAVPTSASLLYSSALPLCFLSCSFKFSFHFLLPSSRFLVCSQINFFESTKVLLPCSRFLFCSQINFFESTSAFRGFLLFFCSLPFNIFSISCLFSSFSSRCLFCSRSHPRPSLCIDSFSLSVP